MLVVCSRAASHTAVDKLRAAGVEVLVVTGQNEARAGERGADRARLAGHPVDAARGRARTWRAPSSRPARSTRRACSSRPLLAGGRDARTAVEGEGAEQIAAATRALATEVEVIDDDVLITARLKEW